DTGTIRGLCSPDVPCSYERDRQRIERRNYLVKGLLPRSDLPGCTAAEAAAVMTNAQEITRVGSWNESHPNLRFRTARHRPGKQVLGPLARRSRARPLANCRDRVTVKRSGFTAYSSKVA